MADGFSWKLADDRKSVTLSFPTTPSTSLQLDANGLDELLKTVGDLRAYMDPQHSPDWAPGQTTEAVGSPKWTSEPESSRGDSLLHIRDPRFGWLHYLLPREEAASLSSTMKAQTEAVRPQ